MNSLQLLKFDMISIFKSPLTYIAILLGVLPIGITVGIMVANDTDIDANTMFSVAKWFFSLIGLLFVIKTITRDSGQGTIQLYLNSVRSRIGYFVTKFLSIICIAVLTTAVVLIITYIIQWTTKGKDLKTDQIGELLVFYLILFLVYGLLLFLINLFVQKPSLVFTLGILLLLILPVVKPFIPLIPEIGDNLEKSMKYIPISYLSDKSLEGKLTFTNWQWFINIASIVVLTIANFISITKKDI
ncbi:phenol-soluble modulin export ABC transporter permease subunit PmtD [Staphylococcus canis]|uniref:ABC transporter permease subunit n=1 Tax=Staphylococcus canis TaxID=2724942 RepID=A0ABS0T7R1_9STAP|nr:ABC transporter permease subunit [Staphylococcus canis]MBI5974777.1 ABC transporter permease subunit [Staphylococcus canis]